MANRTLGLIDALLIGLGAIVGGGILALAGHALARVGPATLLVFALNGALAALTAAAFAELATRFPVSGGAYAYARKVLGVRSAFAVGWVLWFAYIVAGVLYALGAAVFGVVLAGALLPGGLSPTGWAVPGLAMASIGLGALQLARSGPRGGSAATWGKLAVFAALIAVGLAGWPVREQASLESLRGALGAPASAVFGAMGLTFIALQGFDAIATVAGEVKNPRRTLPLAMLGSVLGALVLYLPLLAVTLSAAEPGAVVGMAREGPETVLADAARLYAGAPGWWMVTVAGVLSMYSALQANLLAASRVAQAMARNRTLPRALGEEDGAGTPLVALRVTAVAMGSILLVVPDLASAGAASSLIFLLTFAAVHAMAYLARRRLRRREDGFCLPGFPVPQVLGGVLCLGLAASQLLTEPGATAVTALWLALGVGLYSTVLAGRAEALDAFAQVVEEGLPVARGVQPLILVPVADPARAPALVALASAIAPPQVGEVLLLTVARPDAAGLSASQALLGDALRPSLSSERPPQALLAFGDRPAATIADIVRQRRCAALVVGASRLDDGPGSLLGRVLDHAAADVVVLRSPPDFSLPAAQRVLVPIGGRGGQDLLRARLLGALLRSGQRRVRLLRVLPVAASAWDERAARRQLAAIAEDEAGGQAEADVLRSDSVQQALLGEAARSDLLVLGMLRIGGGRSFGALAQQLAEEAPCAVVFVGRRG